MLLVIGFAVAIGNFGRSGPTITYEEAQSLSEAAKSTLALKDTPCTKCGGTNIVRRPLFSCVSDRELEMSQCYTLPYECADCEELHGFETNGSSQYARAYYALASSMPMETRIAEAELSNLSDAERRELKQIRSQNIPTLQKMRQHKNWLKDFLATQTRPAKLSDYSSWLKGHLERGGNIDHYYDYPWSLHARYVGWYVANGLTLELQPLYGTESFEIIIPAGVTVTGNPGGSSLYYMDGSQHYVYAPLFNDPELLQIVKANQNSPVMN